MTEELSPFDLGQLLLFDELLRGFEPTHGRSGSIARAVGALPPVFDLPVLADAARHGGEALSSLVAQVHGWAADRADWGERREQFTAAARSAHLAEAQRRLGG
jgi:hypothetical protein